MSMAQKKSWGINMSIIEKLKEYNEKIPMDFLAKLVGRSSSEIKGHLEKLKEEGIVKCDGDDVSLLEKTETDTES